jgi:hypothetical protein
MSRLIGFAALLMVCSSMAFAGAANVPEIDPSTGAGALALVAGGLVVLRARRRR